MTNHPTTLRWQHGVVSYYRGEINPIRIWQTITRGTQKDELATLELSREQAIMLRASLDEAIKESRG